MEEKIPTKQEQLETIARALEAQRHRLGFVRSSLFFGAGWIALATLTAQFILERLTEAEWLWYLLWLPAAIAGIGLLLIWRDKHRTLTVNDRTLINVWLFALGITGYTAIYTNGQLPIAGFLVVGMSIAVGFTSELFRRTDSNKSNQSGTLVVLQFACMSGALLAAWIFRAALDGENVAQFILTFVAVAILLLGTGAVLRYNERHSRV